MSVFVYAPTEEYCASGVWMKYQMMRRSSTIRNLSIHYRKNHVGCAWRPCKVHCLYNMYEMSVFCRLTSKSNFPVIRYCKWYFRRTCQHIICTSGLGVLFEKADLARQKAYRDGSIGYATSSGTLMMHTWGSSGLNPSILIPIFGQHFTNTHKS